MGVDTTEPSTWVKGKQALLWTTCPQKGGAYLFTKEETQLTMGVDSTEHGSRFKGE